MQTRLYNIIIFNAYSYYILNATLKMWIHENLKRKSHFPEDTKHLIWSVSDGI